MEGVSSRLHQYDTTSGKTMHAKRVVGGLGSGGQRHPEGDWNAEPKASPQSAGDCVKFCV